jgi:hypothetical protein
MQNRYRNYGDTCTLIANLQKNRLIMRFAGPADFYKMLAMIKDYQIFNKMFVSIYGRRLELYIPFSFGTVDQSSRAHSGVISPKIFTRRPEQACLHVRPLQYEKQSKHVGTTRRKLTLQSELTTTLNMDIHKYIDHTFKRLK